MAPRFYRRHTKEFQLSTAINVRILPSRIHTMFLAFHIFSNITYCCLLNYHHQLRSCSSTYRTRGRTSHLAIVNMLPPFILSARSNSVLSLNIFFDTFNLFQRWVRKIVFLKAFAHTLIWDVNNYDAQDLEGLTHHLQADPFLLYSFISTVPINYDHISINICYSACNLRIIFTSPSTSSQAAIADLVLHCEVQLLPRKPFIYVLIAL
jgi:hypothetical protein